MTFHVVSLPHTQTTKDYVHCAYTEKVRKFCDMMMSLGHTVYLYASEDNQAACTELITCITKEQQLNLIGIEKPTDNGKVEFDPGAAYWKLMNLRAAEEIKLRQQPHDFVCLIAGRCQQQIAEALPHLLSVEFGIGYGGVFSDYKVFESYAWMHTVYGALNGPDAHKADGQWYDAVIPNYYDLADFPKGPAEKEDYYLYVGRLIERKGWRIAQEVCEKIGKRLIVAGQGDFSGYGEYVGTVGMEKRNELMAKAQAVFVPSLYLEPFGGVQVEAMLCGTPVITSDWGAFSEIVENGENGYRCRTFQEFIDATAKVRELLPYKIRNSAADRFSTDVVKKQYEAYFQRLLTLWDKGWYTLK